MPETGTYQLVLTGFDANRSPFILSQRNDASFSFNPLEYELSLRFDTTQRFCTGWRDMQAGKRYACPDSKPIEAKYETCSACQQRTGFNPAFYNATSVSPQQEQRNQLPHTLYLAYFGDGVTKVGITLASRVKSRLLEQGARSAIVLGEFATANIARQHEATIAKLDSVYETVSSQRKMKVLENRYDDMAAEVTLRTTLQRITDETKTAYDGTVVQHLDTYYFPHGAPNLAKIHSVANEISGKVVGMIGSILLCENNDQIVGMPLKHYAGYYFELGNSATDLELPAEQLTLL